MYLKHGDKNTAVIINSMTNNGKQLIMVQKFIPKAVYGDKRVLILGEEILPYCVQKLQVMMISSSANTMMNT